MMIRARRLARRTLIATARRIAPRQGVRQGDLIVAASNFGSVGDLAMVQGLQELLFASGAGTPWIASSIADGRWSIAGPLFYPSAIPSRALDYLAWARPARELSRVFLNGADVLDGRYSVSRSLQRLEFCRFCDSLGATVTITGFSIRQDPAPSIVEAFRKLPSSIRLCARDPVSRVRVEAIVGRNVVQVADLAFMVSPRHDSRVAAAAIESIRAWHEQGAHVVAICPNRYAVHPDCGASDEEARAALSVDFFAALAARFRETWPSMRFVFVSHDNRGTNSDFALCERIRRHMLTDVSLQLPIDASPSEIKAVLGECDALVSGRLHCGIAALGMGTPTALLDYQGKVAGLLERQIGTSMILCFTGNKEK